MTCPSCKETSGIKAKFRFCPYCGERIAGLDLRIKDIENKVAALEETFKERRPELTVDQIERILAERIARRGSVPAWQEGEGMNEKKIYADGVEFACQVGWRDAINKVLKIIDTEYWKPETDDIIEYYERIKAAIKAIRE